MEIKIDTFDAAVDASMEAVGKRLGQNLIRTGAYIQNQSMRIVPVHQGNLKAGAATRHKGTGVATVVSVVYVAAYAIFVHENTDALHGEAFNTAYADKIEANPGHPYWFNRGPDQKSHFLSSVLVTKSQQIEKLIKSGI